MDDQAMYQQAKKRVGQIKGFYWHLVLYVLVNALLLIINLVTSPTWLWFYWPLLGWGMGIAAHWVSVFGIGNVLGQDWEERKIKELMDKKSS